MELDSLAGSLLTTVALAGSEKWQHARAAIDAFAKIGLNLEININGGALGQEPPIAISSLSLRGRQVDWKAEASASAADLVAATISVLLTLLPIDEEPNSPSDAMPDFGLEGAKARRTVNVYERSRSNRALAILSHGLTCLVCETNFGEKYGSIGEGYIEIHHLTPVHLMGGQRRLNPLEELVPLCANCHRMVHRTDPPYTPDELRQSLHDAGPMSK
jgi:5-methylcytosine-specific restriction protein A